jgi:adenylate cyclase
LGNTLIPTDPWGRILIPFRGRPYSFPYLSASDLLNGKIEEEQVRDKLIFIGLSATAASDLVATAISPVFPGVEVQASIASGIIDHYLPHKPNWGRGAAIALVLILGIGAAITFPYISKVVAFLGSALIILILEGVNYWVWTRHQIVLAFFFPMPTLVTLFILDLISAYIADIREKKKNQ